MSEQRWVFVVRALDQPGTLTAAASVFSNRGVSLEAILGSGIAATAIEEGRLILSFRATERKQEMLLRALERLSSVLQVTSYLYDDPKLRAIAIAKVSSLQDISFDSEAIVVETIATSPDGLRLLLTGSTVAVEQVIQTLRQASVLLDLVTAAITL
jgi:acetolactate synthase small subunit